MAFEPPQRLVRALDEARRDGTEQAGGSTGAGWLGALPALVASALARWALTVERVHVPGGRTSLVLLVRRANGSPAVLKLAPPFARPAQERAALAHWAGRGAVRLLDGGGQAAGGASDGAIGAGGSSGCAEAGGLDGVGETRAPKVGEAGVTPGVGETHGSLGVGETHGFPGVGEAGRAREALGSGGEMGGRGRAGGARVPCGRGAGAAPGAAGGSSESGEPVRAAVSNVTAAAGFPGVDEDGALLLERLRPDVPVRSLPEARSMLEAAAALRRLWVEPPGGCGFEGFDTVGARTQRQAAAMRAGAETSGDREVAALVEAALGARDALLAAPPEARLLHGAFRQSKVLAGERMPWLAVGPDPLVGEPAFDLARLVRDRVEDVIASPSGPAITRRRVKRLAESLDVERERLGAWTLFRTVAAAVRALRVGRDRDAELLFEFATWL